MTSINKIIFQDNGAPFSERFNDIYFDIESGFQQSEHVFIQGNEVEKQLLNTTDEFVIGETGFGSGLNFLLTLQLYSRLASQHDLPVLHFISTEKYPLSKSQLIQALTCFETLAPEREQLIAVYPEQFETTLECSLLDNTVKLTIIFDDATRAFAQITLPRKSTGLVNAWYLDGFTPAKNPQMWTAELFSQVARLSKEQATLSTFSVAGFIRRGLEQVGFRLEKKSYLGNKNEILAGKYQQNKLNGQGYKLRANITKPQHVSIIGGGIASACAAYFLTKNGIKVTLYCKDNYIAQGASSNAIGALFPLIHQQSDDISEFYQQAFWAALDFYKALKAQGYHFAHDWCGLLEISYKGSLAQRQKFFEQNPVWPEELVHSIDAIEASKRAKINLDHGGVFFPHSGWIAPQELVQQLILAAKDSNRLRIETSTKVESLTQLADATWQLNTIKGKVNASVVIYCGGAEAIDLPIINQLPLTSVRGQVTSMATNSKIENLNTVICHKGYLTPKNKGVHCIGATFDKNSVDICANKKDDLFNLTMLEKCLPKLELWSEKDVLSSKARLRCMTPDHLPMVGVMPDIDAHKSTYAHLSKDKNWRFNQPAPVIDNLYVLTGLGARGLCTAPLLAEILTADLCGTPYPVDSNMLFNLSPNRFVIRDLIKRKVS